VDPVHAALHGRGGDRPDRVLVTVYDDLRELIVSGQIDPSAVVTESALAQRLSVSRTPVREALQRLAGDGLVRSQGRGIGVVQRSAEELADVYRTRAALEAMLAQAAAERQSAGELAPAQLRRLDDLADQADAVTRAGDLAAAALSNRAFHRAVSELGDNRVALQLLDRLWDQIVVSTRASLTVSDRTSTVHDEHRAILSAVGAGDGPAAAAAARSHALATLEAPGSV